MPASFWESTGASPASAPNKSVEGYIGGILSGAVFLLLYGAALRQFAGIDASLPVMAVYGLVGSAVTELGDLSFSFVKRQFGVKDYGTLLPGHGGMLDRFDSMVFAAPALMLLVKLFPPLLTWPNTKQNEVLRQKFFLLLFFQEKKREEGAYEQTRFDFRFHRVHRAAVTGGDCRLRHDGGGADGQRQRGAPGGAGPAGSARSWL